MSSQNTTILVVGGTGKQGGACVSALLSSPSASSLTIRFLTRNPDSGSSKKLIEKGLKAFKGDLSDKSSLKEALTGCDKAFFMTDAAAGEEKEGDQGVNFVDVAKECGVKFLVFSSVSAADIAVNVPHFRSKYRVSLHYFLFQSLNDPAVLIFKIDREAFEGFRVEIYHLATSSIYGQSLLLVSSSLHPIPPLFY